MGRILRQHPELSLAAALLPHLQAYARRFKLYEHIKLQCKLVQLRRSSASGWTVLYHDLKQDKYFQVSFSFQYRYRSRRSPAGTKTTLPP